MQSRVFKKAVALALAWCIAVSCVPAAAFAEGADAPISETAAAPAGEDFGTPEPAATEEPTFEAVPVPTEEPTETPETLPAEAPTAEATPEPVLDPTDLPAPETTLEPTTEPTVEPAGEPTQEPTPALETEETQEPTEVATAQPSFEPTAEPTPTISGKAQAVQDMLNALPAADALTAMDAQALAAAFMQTEAAYEAYLDLSAEEQTLVAGAEKFEALFAVFNAQTATLDGTPGKVTFTVRGGAGYTADEGETFFAWLAEQNNDAFPQTDCKWQVQRGESMVAVDASTTIQEGDQFDLVWQVRLSVKNVLTLYIFGDFSVDDLPSDLKYDAYSFAGGSITVTHTINGQSVTGALTDSTSISNFAARNLDSQYDKAGRTWYDESGNVVTEIALKSQTYTSNFQLNVESTRGGTVALSRGGVASYGSGRSCWLKTGESVELTFQPEDDYQLNNLVDGKGGSLFSGVKDGKYTYTMGQNDDGVRAIFEETTVSFRVNGYAETATTGSAFLEWAAASNYATNAKWQVWRAGVSSMVDDTTIIQNNDRYQMIWGISGETLRIYQTCEIEDLPASGYQSYIVESGAVITVTHEVDGQERSYTLDDFGMVGNIVSTVLGEGRQWYCSTEDGWAWHNGEQIALRRAVYASFYDLICGEAEKGACAVDLDASADAVQVNEGKFHARAGSTVYLNVTPETGFETDTVTVTMGNGQPVDGAFAAGKKQYSFTMPSGNVSVAATFKAIEGFHSVTAAQTENGTVALNQPGGVAGETITLTVVPESGYALESLTVSAGGANVSCNRQDAGYAFVMPDAEATVTAVFTKVYGLVIDDGLSGMDGLKVTAAVTGNGYTYAIQNGDITQCMLPAGEYTVTYDTVTVPEECCEDIPSDTFTVLADETIEAACVSPVLDADKGLYFAVKPRIALKQYTVTGVNVLGGTVSASLYPDCKDASFALTACYGDKIYLEIAPGTGFAFKADALSITCTDANGAVHPVDYDAEQNCFRMPLGNVRISAAFELSSTSENASFTVVGAGDTQTFNEKPGTKFIAWLRTKATGAAEQQNWPTENCQWRVTSNGRTLPVDENTPIVPDAVYTLLCAVKSENGGNALEIYDSCTGSDIRTDLGYSFFRIVGSDTAVTVTHTLDGASFTQTLTADTTGARVTLDDFVAKCAVDTSGRVWYVGSAKGTYLRLQPQEYTSCYRLYTGAQSVRFAKIEFSPSIAGEGEYANDAYTFDGGAVAGTVIQMTFRPVGTTARRVIPTLTTTGGSVAVTRTAENVYTFTMPAAAVQLTTKTYAAHDVAVASCKHGRIAADRTLAYVDDSVRVTVFPESGYQLSTMTVTADNGSMPQPQKNADGSYTFVMPDCAVTIAAAFEAVKLSGSSWNDDETPKPTAATKPARTSQPVKAAPGENLLYAAYLGTGGDLSELNVVFDGDNSPADYELLGVLASGEAQNGSVIVRTLPDANGAAVRRSLILSAAQLTRLAQEKKMDSLLFENGGAAAGMEMADLLEGDLPKLMALILSGKEEITPETLNRDWSAVQPAALSKGALARFQVETRIVPMEQTDGGTAYEISVWLRWGERELDVSGMIPSLRVYLNVDAPQDEADRAAFAQRHAVGYRAPEANAFAPLESTLTQIPEKQPERQPDEAQRFIVYMPAKGGDPATFYDADAALSACRHDALAAKYAGAGGCRLLSAE